MSDVHETPVKHYASSSVDSGNENDAFKGHLQPAMFLLALDTSLMLFEKRARTHRISNISNKYDILGRLKIFPLFGRMRCKL